MLAMKWAQITDYVIEYSFYLIFFLVPLIWLPTNYELFEFNKMILTYILTMVIGAAWICKILITKEFKFKRTPLDWFILTFLAANLLSTIFSIDVATSIFGYYSRFNGGLLSTIAYTILYFALTNNFDKKKAEKLLLVGLVSGFLVAIYGILQHPNPLFAKMETGKRVLHGIDWQYWAEAVETRVFSTLGQPNWLAAYLAMLLPVSISFMLFMERHWQKLIFLIFSIASFLALTFTLSRGGTLGLIATATAYSILFLLYKQSLTNKLRQFFHLRPAWPKLLGRGWLWLGVFLVAVIVINAQFGNAFGLRAGLPKTSAETTQISGLSQLEIGGSQTSQIRLIVWKGAIDIFKHYPLLGTGVETFGYSYYLYRPAEHNQTVEWDFLYNKAHNEYLNYLTNNGLVGFTTYLALISFFIVWALLYLIRSEATKERLLVLALFAAYTGYLVQNFFGFSVVILANFFYMFPALAFIFTETTREVDFPTAIKNRLNKPEVARLVLTSNLIIGAILLVFISRMWLADTYYARSGSSDNSSNYRSLKAATELQPFEPTFQAELAASAASLAGEVDDTNLRERLVNEAVTISNRLAASNPNHTFVARQRLQTYYALSQIDKKYLDGLVKAAIRLGEIAPTDASIQYNVAVSYWIAEKNEEALKQINKVLLLKPDYPEAKVLKDELTKPNA